MADIDRLIRALTEAQADPTEEAVTRCLGMARAMRDQERGVSKAEGALREVVERGFVEAGYTVRRTDERD